MDMLKSLKITVVAEDSVSYDSALLGQHGISLLLTANCGSGEKNILVDVAQDPRALLANLEKMAIAPACIDAIVLTHCHYDHTRGLTRILGAIDRDDIPVIAHPDLFRLNFVQTPFLRHVGVMPGDLQPQIETAGGVLFLTRDPLQIMPGLMTTGEVERITDFEDPGIDLYTIENGRVKTDAMPDDISLVANLEGSGLIVVTGCCHAGIVNVLAHARRIAGVEKIGGLIGGLHLVEASDDRIKKTVEGIGAVDPDWVYAGHCTGFRAQAALCSALNARFSPLQTGMVIDIT
jgi:7,8-dihydropterin-6-yl-methyl-4-(beta-D-ribofuranosyl)aminobenzene 5'-phosphate synthase